MVRTRSQAQGPVCEMPFTPNWGQVAGAGLGGALGASRAAAFADLPIPGLRTLAESWAGAVPSVAGSFIGQTIGQFFQPGSGR
jgi:hypothetical protein